MSSTGGGPRGTDADPPLPGGGRRDDGRPPRGLIELFLEHRLAANLLVALMVLTGAYALTQLNTQFFPNFELDFITVEVPWSGASAEDVERAVIEPLEQDLRTVDGLRAMTSTSALGVGVVTLEFEAGTDMTQALEQVNDRVSQQRNLPEEAETPVTTRIVRYEPVARLLVTGPEDPRQLRTLARRFERELLDAGIARIEFTGLTEDEVAIQVPAANLYRLDMTLAEIGEEIRAMAQDLPAGSVGREDTARQLRSLEQARAVADFERLVLRGDAELGRMTLGDVADIERRHRDGEVRARANGQRAIVMQLLRTETGDSLEAARVLEDWLERTRPVLPPGVELEVTDAFWELIAERIALLLKNGIGGLLLVLGILFLFLNRHIALRVAVGIPIAFTAAFVVLWAVGGSINMISLFGFIMSLGIIVDNAIVVSEHAYSLHQRGLSASRAARDGARRMVGPVFAASLTTVAAFLPLMLIGGIIGNILFDIPLVVVCVILATLLIAFLILPAHLQGVMHRLRPPRPGSLRQRFDSGFEALRDGPFRRAVSRSIDHSATTLALAVGALILAIGLAASGRIGFTFFPSPEGTVVNAGVNFVAGTSPERVEDFLLEVEQALDEAEAALGGDLVRAAITRLGQGTDPGDGNAPRGEQFGSMQVELVSPEQREVRNREFIRAWRERVRLAPGIENFSIDERQAGPPGRDLEVRLTGGDPQVLKAAAVDLAATFDEFPGTFATRDDTPFGREQLVFAVRPEGRALGLSTEAVGAQLRHAYEGHLAQLFQDGLEEVEVRVRLPDRERHATESLERLHLRLPGGAFAPLGSVVELRSRQGFETLRHADTRLAIQVSTEVDRSVNNAARIRAALEDGPLEALAARYGIEYSFEGRAADQAETFADMRTGLVLALALMYITLAWVFASWGWPLIVMAIIPFGILGALLGHWMLNVELTILSLFGLFGLTGIVVNNSIILVSFYQGLREDGLALREAIVEAACQRLRAVILTSVTTIAGLTPLLFERSVQAQFLVPMAISIVFGLAVATVLVLFVIPALLRLYEGWFDRGATGF
ncbi:efflux RND transporter permease subunit [Spiribacter halobius]|uniref:Acriflavin resistance protein n=1 Tax=Sediminicurvatus halobius TaxID=2182432 RepID=A0A2U2N4M6_9GAMM|nr:efflux RND transporter permease subunit [Spiribacter halobius]PWG64032.1 acriflavin resistance protein [Spiribacter halobius]UEX76914.1 efflux RND transporter permease subunit [Spiribacter halobius]